VTLGVRWGEVGNLVAAEHELGLTKKINRFSNQFPVSLVIYRRTSDCHPITAYEHVRGCDTNRIASLSMLIRILVEH
jgi:hypothetical protein